MMQLDPRAAAAGVRLIVHDLVASTNADALQRARDGELGPLWIAATRQSAGRGRRGRPWVSEPGNLYASLLLTHMVSASPWAELSFVAALALHDAVVEVVPKLKPRLAIKWPNDLLLDGAKFAGILIEGEGAGTKGGVGAVAIGIGVNCASHPAATDHPATDLAAAGFAVTPATLFAALTAKMLGRLAQWNAGEGFSTIRADWLARAAGVGEEIRVQLPDRALSGRFEALDDAGGLVLRLPDGSRQVIAAGDVFMSPASRPETAR
jgi:BirA family biotin operon repressor/biotin-[acetyl-CoA-carboxylase] ligase